MATEKTLDEKYARLLDVIRAAAGDGGAAVAFSGGVDSSFLCRAARDALGERALAVTVVSPMLPKSELDCAKTVAAGIGIRHVLVEEPEIEPEVAANPRDRCYHCKKIEFGTIQSAAAGHGAAVVLDGTNIDDEGDYRPGMKAIAELGVVSPLRQAGLAKQDIRDLSRRFGLATWDKPAFACLASRIPYGERIDTVKLARVEKAEDALRRRGFRQFRVRSHGEVARIEVARDERRRFFDLAMMDAVSRDLKAAGFTYAALELEGYRMGSLNQAVLA